MILVRLSWLVLAAACLTAGCGGDGKSGCQEDRDCPSGNYCQTSTGNCVHDCVNDGDCQAGEVCTARGRCQPGCKPTNDGVEDCDGVDNDCDGETDEELDRACHQESGFGRCTGTESCRGGFWICDAPVPAAEDCDGVDNDCDGETDEGQENLICPLEQGVCQGSVRICQGKDGWSDCDYGDAYQSEEDRCDDLDNDCDGETDEDLTGNPCFEENALGRCDGVERCRRGAWECDAPVPGPEECDNQDNDCDGETDEGAEPIPDCETGLAAFDGVDNNCNRLIDEPGGCLVHIQVDPVDVYMDAYEATVFENPDCSGQRFGLDSDDYPADWPAESTGQWTDLYACSLPGLRPSRHISRYRAQRACHAQGKRLCTRQEYWLACAGENANTYPYGDEYRDDACNTFTAGYDDTVAGGSLADCQSSTGVYDMSGNLWEWVSNTCEEYPLLGTIQGGSYQCEICVDQDCTPCDSQDQVTIDSMHSCYYAGPAGWWCDFPTLARPTFGFRCCWDPP